MPMRPSADGGRDPVSSSRRARASSRAGRRPHRQARPAADAVSSGRRREATSIQTSDEPRGTRGSGTLRPKTRAKVAVVGHDEEFVRGFRARGGADVVGERQDHPVGSSTAGIANTNAGRDALAADPSFRGAVEHQLDRRPRRDHRRRRPIRVAGGCGWSPRDRAWSKFDPSTISRDVFASGSRGRSVGGLPVTGS
jgi:hypothetical protein